LSKKKGVALGDFAAIYPNGERWYCVVDELSLQMSFSDDDTIVRHCIPVLDIKKMTLVRPTGKSYSFIVEILTEEKSRTFSPIKEIYPNLSPYIIAAFSHCEVLTLTSFMPIARLSGRHCVYLSAKKGTGELFVVKELTLSDGCNEAEMLRRFAGNPFIIQLHQQFTVCNSVFLVLEYASGGSLSDFRKDHTFTLAELKRILAQVATGIKTLHDNGIVHGDVKLDNIVMKDGHAVLADFETCFDLRCPPTHLCGTHQYMPPELLSGDSRIQTPARDWWSFGVLAYELLYGYPPFRDAGNLPKLYENIRTRNPRFPRSSGDDVNMCQFLAGLLDKNPQTRLGPDILNHPFLAGVDISCELSLQPRQYTDSRFSRGSLASFPDSSKDDGIVLILSTGEQAVMAMTDAAEAIGDKSEGRRM
jgi:serine/threonine protein kinase